jgi:Coenzyme PQQ synthesis protein D (PqqD)
MRTEISKASTVVVGKDNVWCDMGGEAVILNLQSGIYYGLNAVGAEVWKIIQEPTRVNTVLKNLLQTYGVAPDRCAGDLFALLQDLAAKNLIVIDTGTNGAAE